MKIMISFPPFESEKGVPLLSQNRQFQWFNEPTFIYPVVPAQAASLLKSEGYDTIWLDGIAERLSFQTWLKKCVSISPDILMMETKTPVIKKHWEIIKIVKKELPETLIVLTGDHVTAFPEETFKNSPVDYILTGGNYDFMILNLVRYLDNSDNKMKPGIYYRSKEDSTRILNSGKFCLNDDLNKVPFIDRDLTKWELYAYHNGNYKKTPGTYIMAARDCWYHQCTFCSWTTLYPNYKKRSPENVLNEIGELIEKFHVKEIMDDSGSFPIGEWLKTFCEGMIERGYHKRISIDCNMRLGSALNFEEMKLMKKAGFRLILVGIESANRETLDHIKKGEKIDSMVQSVYLMRKAGLFPHITIMFGYPWEKMPDAKNTLNLGKKLLIKNAAYTMQATIMTPYPGTPLFEECRKNNWLRTEDWDRYDMREPIMKAPLSDEELMGLVQSLYRVSFNPEFLIRKLLSIRDIEDVLYFIRAGKKVFGHIFDFGNKKEEKLK